MPDARYRRPAVPAALRAEVFERDKGVCAECGEHDPDWQADHRIPLWKAHGLGDDWFNSLENVQTLCRRNRCHARKSAREAAERAKYRRIARRDGMTKLRRRGREPLPF